jgi:hypothetical protein
MRYFDVAVSPVFHGSPTEHRLIKACDAAAARRGVRESLPADWQVWPALG